MSIVVTRKSSLAREYYDALKELASFMSIERLKRESDRKYGLPADEAIEMAYENMLSMAQSAIKGRRRPE